MTTYDTPYGPVFDGGSCKDDYPNINIYHQTQTRIVKLQGPALRAFKAAEERCATRRKPHILITGIGWRSCSLQREPRRLCRSRSVSAASRWRRWNETSAPLLSAQASGRRRSRRFLPGSRDCSTLRSASHMTA